MARLRPRPAAPQAMPKRTDPCPCGSGKPFKDCHLKQLLAERRAERDKGS